MPIRDYEVECEESGPPTITTTGRVDTAEESGVRYMVRWNYEEYEPRIPFLVCLGGEGNAVSASFLVAEGGFAVAEPEDHDWSSTGLRILTRAEVVGTPLAAAVFRVIDEIWLYDPELGGFLGSNSLAFDSRDISEEALTKAALESDGPRESWPEATGEP
ncbi:hypothetical protein [Luteolibacter soli]|uniref:Uncharacterized protein n=1 Tax=Luteolibacter soli TaxID=3135280 RepID=A0ABU9AYS3_9BACT